MNVTIIVPFYNREKYLRDTLNSIKNQHFKHWRAILIDDMSEDSSLLIAKEFGEQDSRFIIIENTIKQRQGKAKNQGIEYVLWANSMLMDSKDYNNVDFISNSAINGGGGISIFGKINVWTNYILFLDSDDLLDKSAIYTLISKAIYFDSDITIGSTQCFGEKSNHIIHKEGLIETSKILKKPRYFSFGWGGLIKIHYFMNGLRFIDSAYVINDDNFFGLDLFGRTKMLYYTSQICVYYRVACGSISHPKSYLQNGYENLYQTYYLNAYYIKSLLKKYPKYAKILRFNISYNANAFISTSNILHQYEKEKIKEMYRFLDAKYKIFAHSPSVFARLKSFKNLLKNIKIKSK